MLCTLAAVAGFVPLVVKNTTLPRTAAAKTMPSMRGIRVQRMWVPHLSNRREN
jgi:hypothetical protein